MKRSDEWFWNVLGQRSWLARNGFVPVGEHIRAGCPDEALSDEPDEDIIAKAPRGFVAGELP